MWLTGGKGGGTWSTTGGHSVKLVIVKHDAISGL